MRRVLCALFALSTFCTTAYATDAVCIDRSNVILWQRVQNFPKESIDLYGQDLHERLGAISFYGNISIFIVGNPAIEIERQRSQCLMDHSVVATKLQNGEATTNQLFRQLIEAQKSKKEAQDDFDRRKRIYEDLLATSKKHEINLKPIDMLRAIAIAVREKCQKPVTKCHFIVYSSMMDPQAIKSVEYGGNGKQAELGRIAARYALEDLNPMATPPSTSVDVVGFLIDPDTGDRQKGQKAAAFRQYWQNALSELVPGAIIELN